MGGAEKCEVDEEFLAYMDATAEGGAYLGPDGTWRSVRDTWCNSHREIGEQGRNQMDLKGQGDAEETSEESPEPTSEDEFDRKARYIEVNGKKKVLRRVSS